jgi:hypothetical protein
MEPISSPAHGGDSPRIRVLSLGAGPQSGTLLLLAAQGKIRRIDAAIWADPGWQPAAVYEHFGQLTQVAQDAGIPVHRVTGGDIRADALDPGHRFASMPLWYRSETHSDGAGRRQCVSEYKARPIKAMIRELLGYPPPARVRPGVFAELSVAITADEPDRAREPDVRYIRYAYPLAELGWSASDCAKYMRGHGFRQFPSASCLGCPLHRDRWWARLRDQSPAEWADVVAFDAAIRHGYPRITEQGQQLRGTYYLHASRQPLDQADISAGDEGSAAAAAAEDDATTRGCSPWAAPRVAPAPRRQPAAVPRRERRRPAHSNIFTKLWKLIARHPGNPGKHAAPRGRRRT